MDKDCSDKNKEFQKLISAVTGLCILKQCEKSKISSVQWHEEEGLKILQYIQNRD